MKNIYRVMFIVMFQFVFVSMVNAQIQLSINIGSQPAWGPVGYETVQYYYLPDMDAYYYVPQRLFYFHEGGRWIGRSALPVRYKNFDMYRTYKVVVNEREPWRSHETYRVRYLAYKGRQDQQLIRDSREPRYLANKRHPEHKTWVKEQKSAVKKYDKNNQKSKNNGHGNGKHK
ncbi:MAG: hypothetical protein HYV28_04560 [Ignavibacteriales bacterium]|nr:hypothetical protein [Ignavibacteriales bacterium]